MRLLALVLSLLALCTQANADEVDDIVNAYMQRTHTPGLSLAVVRDGKIIREQGYGLANVEHQVPVGPDTLFQSGSVGKQFTAALVMLLARDGKLQLDAPIARYLPHTPKSWSAITVRHLLTHTSGVGDPEKKVDLRKDYTDTRMIALAASMPLRFQPGARWEYSNTGYHLLGYICNRAGGKFYGDQLRERIFAPLGMSTRIISERDIVPHRAAGYEWRDGQLTNQEWVSPTMNRTADGSLYLTARDLALWDLALYDDKILDAAAREASWTPVRLKDGGSFPYGFGWDLAPVNGHRRIAHNGLWQGFRSQFSRFVDDRLTVVVLGNSSSAPAEKIASLVAAHYLPGLVPPVLPDTDPEANAHARDIVTHFERGVAPPRLSKAARKQFTPEFMAMVAQDMGEFGKIGTIEPIERKAKDNLRQYAYRLRGEHDTAVMRFAVNKAGEVEAIGVFPD
ncbi:beta-lactamase family protein [Massilia sp. Dwa41.01b]|uniref:serine hydrolase domain-containing protein n=1 Tax=unclassified Massilia TaxID=2609279 RepID=UPI001602D999|nr:MULTISPECIES: serine hydrolase domain-containing protein [unclassified Massilia]QNA87907.1 beta-lactamase family protein [Massilia sp. Dwa41.01b]QNA98810.1 beta-lactamase family protein [Massilia sp. Se16.2.3]